MVKKITTLINAVITVTIVLVIITIIFNTSSILIPEAQAAGNDINKKVNVLGSFFVGSNIIFLVVVVACFVLVLRTVLSRK